MQTLNLRDKLHSQNLMIGPHRLRNHWYCIDFMSLCLQAVYAVDMLFKTQLNEVKVETKSHILGKKVMFVHDPDRIARPFKWYLLPRNSVTTVDREIFAVKNFSPVAWVAKIKRAKKSSFALYLQCK